MDGKNVVAGVKVTYIETQFVTSDAAGFKDLVQRLTGRSADPPGPHRPRPCRPDGRGGTAAAAGAGPHPQGCYRYPVAEARPAVDIRRTPPCQLEDYLSLDDFDMGNLSDMFFVGASERSDGCYSSFPY